MTTSERINLVLRVTTETAIVVALGSWGYHTGGSTPARIGLMLVAPLVGFGFWGAVDFHQTGRLAEPLRLTQELAVSGLAAIAWYAAGHHTPAVALAALSLMHFQQAIQNEDFRTTAKKLERRTPGLVPRAQELTSQALCNRATEKRSLCLPSLRMVRRGSTVRVRRAPKNLLPPTSGSSRSTTGCSSRRDGHAAAR
jgi:Protein of unknown function (DUF2568)